MLEKSFNELIAARKRCRLCMAKDQDEIINGAEYSFDPNVVSYWSQWLGHPQPEMVIVGQDFSDSKYFEKYIGRDEPDNPTNEKLRKLLNHAGVVVAKAPERDSNARIFLTNSILCLKRPPMNRDIKERWVRLCTSNHLVPLLQKLNAPIVVGMGRLGWMATRQSLDIEAPSNIGLAAGRSWRAKNGTIAFAVGHCGPLGLANRNWQKQQDDWVAIGKALADVRSLRERG